MDIKPAAGSQSAPNIQDNASIAESMPADCRTLFVKNLPYEFKEDDVGDRFRPFGEIEEVRVPRNWQNNNSKGFAFVKFKEHESAKLALAKMNGKELNKYPGRRLKVDFDVRQTAKKSFKVNLEDEGNTRFNKQIKKDVKQKFHRKDIEKKKFEKFRK